MFSSGMMKGASAQRNINRSTTAAGLGAAGASPPSFAIGTLPAHDVVSPSEMASNRMVSFNNNRPPLNNHSTMSDLDSVVAGFLTVANLYEENESMRRQLREIRAVKITGPNGSPVYARAQLDGHQAKFIGRNTYEVSFRPLTLLDAQQWQQPLADADLDPLAPCSVHDLNSLEVHVGNMRFELGRNNDSFMIYKLYFSDIGHGNCRFDSNPRALTSWPPYLPIFGLSFQIGPFPSRSAFEAFDLNRVATLERAHPIVSFYNVHFKAECIKGLLDNFEQRRPPASPSRLRGNENDGDNTDD